MKTKILALHYRLRLPIGAGYPLFLPGNNKR
jgi:hypothetical protein